MSTLYRNRNGYTIAHADGLLIVRDGIDTVTIPITPSGLQEHGKKTSRLADKLIYLEDQDLIGLLELSE